LREFPVLDNISKKFSKDGLVVLTINSDIRTQGMKRELAKAKTSLPVLRDKESKVVTSYRAFGTPSIYLIDRQGKIYDSWMGSVKDLEGSLTDNVSFVLKSNSAPAHSAVTGH
jgi:peroxiredoxin